MRINWKKIGIFAFCLALPLALGGIAGWIVSKDMGIYDDLNLPFFAPPSWLFGVVWPILYVLMGISIFLVMKDNFDLKRKEFIIFMVQLVANCLWPIAFFTWKLFLFAAVWLAGLVILIVWMIGIFYKDNKWAGYLNVPYLLWSIFATILNFSIFFMNM